MSCDTLVQFDRVTLLLFGAWVREALKPDFVLETMEKCSVSYTTGTTAIHIFMVRVYFISCGWS